MVQCAILCAPAVALLARFGVLVLEERNAHVGHAPAGEFVVDIEVLRGPHAEHLGESDGVGVAEPRVEGQALDVSGFERLRDNADPGYVGREHGALVVEVPLVQVQHEGHRAGGFPDGRH